MACKKKRSITQRSILSTIETWQAPRKNKASVPMKQWNEWKERRAEKKRKEFAAKLKYGKFWKQELYPHRYTDDPGPS